MTNKELLQADLLDILFEHRNKKYGAYALRRHYNERLGKAIGIALAISLSFFLFNSFKKDKTDGDGLLNVKAVELINVDIPKEEMQEPEPERQQHERREARSVNNIVITNETDVQTQEDIAVSVVGNENREGEPLVNQNEIVPDTDDKGTQTTKQPEPDPDPTPLPSHPPSFPGGNESWLNYLRKFLNTPDDLEPGQRVEVRVKFWVETDGSISRFEIVQSGGRSFDNEVLRVLKKMPKWEPAVQAGQKVAVSFTQPVIFVGQEEE